MLGQPVQEVLCAGRGVVGGRGRGSRRRRRRRRRRHRRRRRRRYRRGRIGGRARDGGWRTGGHRGLLAEGAAAAELDVPREARRSF